jgi:hypothetical protein
VVASPSKVQPGAGASTTTTASAPSFFTTAISVLLLLVYLYEASLLARLKSRTDTYLRVLSQDGGSYVLHHYVPEHSET